MVQPMLDESITLDTTNQEVDRSSFSGYLGQVSGRAEAKAQERQHAKGKNTARERIDALLDPGSFLEFGQFAGGNIGEGFAGAAVVSGVGTIDGRQVAIYSQDFSVQGGTLGETEGDKIIATIDKALTLRIPIIGILDSGGARIQEGVVALSQYGRIFTKTCAASGVVPQISLILGPCAGGAVYSPALTDFIIMTKENSHMFVTGPDVVRATTGEDVSFAELGGGEVHNARSGVAHYLAEDEMDALDYTRSLLTYLPSNCETKAPVYDYIEEAVSREVASLVPESSKQPYDMTEVISQLVDYGEFLQFQEIYARSILTGFACINGMSVGIVANQPLHDAGTLDVDSSEKAARFVQFCDAFNIPVVTLVDVPGYRPGQEQEQAGIIRRGAKLIWAYATATVPLVTVVLRKAYGGAYIVMGSKSLGGDLVYAWPGAEIAVLGADGATSIIHRRELKEAREQGNESEVKARLNAEYTKENVNPFLSVARGELDAIIDPNETRSTIIASLRALKTKNQTYTGPRKHGNMPM